MNYCGAEKKRLLTFAGGDSFFFPSVKSLSFNIFFSFFFSQSRDSSACVVEARSFGKPIKAMNKRWDEQVRSGAFYGLFRSPVVETQDAAELRQPQERPKCVWKPSGMPLDRVGATFEECLRRFLHVQVLLRISSDARFVPFFARLC